MRTLVGWVAGIFALGLALGGLYSGSLAVEAQPRFADLPTVDCGEGREALFEPVTANGTATLRVKCVPIEAERTRQVGAPVHAAAPAPTPVAAPVAQPPVANVNHEPASMVHQESESRSWKDSALIIGSSAGAGAGIGALAKGKKGAIVGAAIGGVAGTVYDLSTRKKK